MRLFVKQLKFISCFFHILASRCFSLDDQTVVGVILNTLTAAKCIETINYCADYSNYGLQTLWIFKCPCLLMRNICYMMAFLKYAYKLNSYWRGHSRSHVYPQHSLTLQTVSAHCVRLTKQCWGECFCLREWKYSRLDTLLGVLPHNLNSYPNAFRIIKKKGTIDRVANVWIWENYA
jgi:hypothetical protein